MYGPTLLARAGDTQGPLENACHEGNYVLRNILSAARAEDKGPDQMSATITHAIRVVGIVATFVVLVPMSLRAQTVVGSSESWRVPRTSGGHPDFEGVWNFATLTPLERPERFAGRAYMSD